MDFDFDLAPKPAPTQGFPAFQWFKASRDPQSAGVVGFRDQIPPYFEAEARRMGFQTRQVMVDAVAVAAVGSFTWLLRDVQFGAPRGTEAS